MTSMPCDRAVAIMSQRFAKPAALRQLDVDSVNDANETRDVGRHDARLVGDHRKRRAFANEAQAVEIVRGKRLLDVFNATLDEHVDHDECVLGRPRRVRVDAQHL